MNEDVTGDVAGWGRDRGHVTGAVDVSEVQALEGEYVSGKIHEWIDLVFGWKQVWLSLSLSLGGGGDTYVCV